MISFVQIYDPSVTQLLFSGGMCREHINIAKPTYREKGFPFYVYRSSEDACIVCVLGQAEDEGYRDYSDACLSNP